MKKYASDAEHYYENSDGNLVYFEFVGIMDLLELGAECEEVEVWYEMYRKMQPIERRNKLILDDTKLLSRLR